VACISSREAVKYKKKGERSERLHNQPKTGKLQVAPYVAKTKRRKIAENNKKGEEKRMKKLSRVHP